MDQGSKDALRSVPQANKDRENVLIEAVPLFYSELRRLAASYLQRERGDHTLQPTALVHEAYLRLVEQRKLEWNDKGHFFAVAAQMMRRILVDYSRGRHAAKRGGKAARPVLVETAIISDERTGDVLALDEALTVLAVHDPQQAHIVELRFFSGLSIEETATILEISPATVKRNWNMAKAWLSREMRRGVHGAGETLGKD
jgi:RNA polymerase sigma-70 factor (ECF subfamily)